MEIEAHHHAEPGDSLGKIIGIQTALLAIFLSVFTILTNQTTTESIISVNKATDQWAFYQAKRIRDSQLELNIRLLQLMAPVNAETSRTLTEYTSQSSKYKKEAADIKTEAEALEKESKLSHHKTGYFELAEGLLEISMILSSLYFLSHKKLFPILGLLLGLSGCFIGLLGFIHP